MTQLMKASHQWSSRPADERFVSLLEMRDHFEAMQRSSSARVISSRKITAAPDEDNKGLRLVGPEGNSVVPTNWAFKQLSGLAGAPGGYLSKLPSPIAADCLNYGLKFERDIEDVGVLLYRPPGTEAVMRCATGPRYGRIWNMDLINSLIAHFGDGVTGDTFRVPGEFGKVVHVDRENTTLYAGDRDMFVFLADEQHRIEVPNRRNGEPGSLARGFFMWNSEVGSAKFGLSSFLFDYVCCNRIVWGAQDVQEVSIRHTPSAPDRWVDEIKPALLTYANSSAKGVQETIASAREKKIADQLDDFLANRFGRGKVEAIKSTHVFEEGRPIETIWDATVATTAYARTITWQDDRVDFERKAGDMLKLAA